MKLAIVATHPIQYHVPWFRELARTPGVELMVYYGMLPTPEQQGVGFGRAFTWDVPLLDGYQWEALSNRAPKPSLRRFRSSSTPDVGARLASYAPDALVITGWQALPLVQAYAAAVRQRIPRVVRGESNAMRRRPAWTRLAQRAFLSGFHAYAAIGKSNRAFYRDAGVRDEHIFDTPYFVDNERFRRECTAAIPERDAIRSGWSIPADAVCFLYAGKLEPKKHVLDLLYALRQARAAASNVHALVVGSGELMDEARRIAAEQSLPVTFAGFLNQTEMSRAYAAADCLVLPSDYGETWGLVVNEAMCASRPAIVSDRVGCGPDLIDATTGAVFPFGDVGALAALLADLAHSPDRLAAMGDAAWERVRHYSVERAARGTVDAAMHAMHRMGRSAA